MEWPFAYLQLLQIVESIMGHSLPALADFPDMPLSHNSMACPIIFCLGQQQPWSLREYVFQVPFHSSFLPERKYPNNLGGDIGVDFPTLTSFFLIMHLDQILIIYSLKIK